MKIDDKFHAAVSDTDILIDLYKCNSYNILNLLFDKIVIPEYIFEKELKRVVSRSKDISFYEMKKYFEDPESPFEIIYDKEVNGYTKATKRALKEERQDIAGPGEVECACYAKASGIDFVVSNNHTEFIYLNDIAVMLSYYHILTICVIHKKITIEEGERLYNLVNNTKASPSTHTFSFKMKKSWEYFMESGYLKILKLSDFNDC
jgi:hypothetical protein